MGGTGIKLDMVRYVTLPSEAPKTHFFGTMVCTTTPYLPLRPCCSFLQRSALLRKTIATLKETARRRRRNSKRDADEQPQEQQNPKQPQQEQQQQQPVPDPPTALIIGCGDAQGSRYRVSSGGSFGCGLMQGSAAHLDLFAC